MTQNRAHVGELRESAGVVGGVGQCLVRMVWYRDSVSRDGSSSSSSWSLAAYSRYDLMAASRLPKESWAAIRRWMASSS